MKVDIPVLEFKSDGVYLDGRKLSHIKSLWIESDADKSVNISEVEVTGLKTDAKGELFVDEFGDVQEYYINRYVVIKGLDDQQKEYEFN